MKLQTATQLPEIQQIIEWYKNAGSEVLANMSEQDKEICEYDEDGAIGYTLSHKLAEALPEDETTAERLLDYIIYNAHKL